MRLLALVVVAVGFRTGLARSPVACSAFFEVVVFFPALVIGWFSLSFSMMSWNVTFLLVAAFVGRATSMVSDWCTGSGSAFSTGLSFATGFPDRVVLVVGVFFSFASELTVVAVARVARVARLGFSAGFSASVSSAVGSVFVALPRVCGAAVFVLFVFAVLVAGFSSVIEVFFARVERVAAFGSGSSGFSFSSGVTFSLLRGAAARGAAAGTVVAVARVRGAILKFQSLTITRCFGSDDGSSLVCGTVPSPRFFVCVCELDPVKVCD